MITDLRAATDPRFTAWVSANAGAGKTHLLTDRVTRLLLAGAQPSRILCLTYTKAAAAEMASRLFDRLGRWALLPNGELATHLSEIGAEAVDAAPLRQARRLFAQALETPGGLKIQTIHSFCQHLLSRFPVEAGIPARFTVMDDRSAAELMGAARQAVLERAAKGDAVLAQAISILAARAADGRFAEILDTAMANSGRLRAVLAHHGGNPARLFAHLHGLFGLQEGEDETQILKEFCTELRKQQTGLVRIYEWLSTCSATDRKLGASLGSFLDSGMNPEGYEHLRKAFLTTTGETRKNLVTKSAAEIEPGLCGLLESISQRFVATDARRKAAITTALTESLVCVALAVIAEYDGLKRNRAALDYDDLTRATLALLERGDAASWVLYKLDGGLDHVLVDEAQDTSPEQWRIVGALVEEFFAGSGARDKRVRTLFAVGDEKQSIFSFQGADPAEFGRHRAVFRAMSAEAGFPFADVRPPISRRSARAVLEFVDRVFYHDAAREGLTSTGDPVHHDLHRADPGRIEVWPTVKVPEGKDPDPWERPVDAPSRRSAQVKLASRIAARIAHWLRDSVALPGTTRAIVPGDIMILVRRRNSFAEEMIRQLLDLGVPVAGADRMVLMEQIAILDLVALGRFALLPEDDLNLAALLKSPLVGLGEEQLYALAQPRDGHLWDALRERKDENPGFHNAHAFLGTMLGRADFLPPYEFYARALGSGLRRRLVVRLGAEAADAIDEFLALALAHELSHPPSLESFLDWFEKGASDVKRDMEHGAGAVRVMTVHGAKGLEANIVILPDTAQIPDQERRNPLLYAQDCVFYGVSKALETPPITEAKAAAHRREMQEYRRLLYVAATRAREFLIVYGYETKKSKAGIDIGSWYPHLLDAARAIGRKEEIDGEAAHVVGASLSVGVAEARLVQGAASLPEFFTRAAAAEPVSRVLRPSEAAGLEEPAVLSPLKDQGRRFRRGLLVHALLARLPELAREEHEGTALAYLKRQGLSGAEAKELAAETLAIIEHPDFAPLFGQGSRAEVAITAALPELGSVRVNGQIDRLAVGKDAVLVADFKTNRPPPQKIEDTPRIYVTQMALYRAALAKIYPERRIDCALVWTDGARLMPLPHAMLDAEIARIAAAGEPQHML